MSISPFSRSSSACNQLAEEVVLRVGTPFGHQVEVEHGLIDVGLHRLFADLDLPTSRVQRIVDPVPDLLGLLLGHPEHVGDHFDGERRGELLHGVETVRVEAAQILVDLLVHVVRLRLDRPRREHLVEQAAHVAVRRAGP